MDTLLDKTAVRAAGNDPQAIPRSFLARCRAIVESVTSPDRGVPLPLKHRVQDFRPKDRAVYKRRSYSLLVPELNEASVKKTEAILGIILIVIAILLLKPSEEAEESRSNTPEDSLAALAAVAPPAALAPVDDKQETQAEMPYLASALADPAILQQMATVNTPPAYSRFHSFAYPERKLAFSYEPSWKTSYLMSSRAVCSVAQRVQVSMPVILRKGKSAVGSGSGPRGKISPARRTLKHPLVGRMMSLSRKTAYERYVSAHRANPGAVPMIGVMNRFRDLSRVLNESCGIAPAAEDSGGEE